MRLWKFVFAALLIASPAMAEDRVVNFFNWTDYIDPTVITEFTKTTGITVRADTYDSLETLEGKLLAGSSGEIRIGFVQTCLCSEE